MLYQEDLLDRLLHSTRNVFYCALQMREHSPSSSSGVLPSQASMDVDEDEDNDGKDDTDDSPERVLARIQKKVSLPSYRL